MVEEIFVNFNMISKNLGERIYYAARNSKYLPNYNNSLATQSDVN